MHSMYMKRKLATLPEVRDQIDALSALAYEANTALGLAVDGLSKRFARLEAEVRELRESKQEEKVPKQGNGPSLHLHRDALIAYLSRDVRPPAVDRQSAPCSEVPAPLGVAEGVCPECARQ